MAVRVDTAAWNLSVALVLGACGPAVPVDAGSGTSEPGRESSGGPAPECRSNADCRGGYVCYEGACIYECGRECCEGECGPYYDCYTDADCEADEICSSGDCAPLPELDVCPLAPQVLSQIPIDLPLEDVRALAFVALQNEATPALAIGDVITFLARADGNHDYAAAVPATSIAAGDANGDGDQDLMLLSEGVVEVYRQRDPDEIAAEPFDYMQTLDEVDADAIAVADYDHSGSIDLFIAGDDGLVVHHGAGSAFSGAMGIDDPTTVLAAIRDASTGFGALAYQLGETRVVQAPDGLAVATLPEHAPAPIDRRLYASDLDGNLLDDVIGVSLHDGRTQASAWWDANPGIYPERWSLPTDVGIGAAGDLDADGRDDLVLGGPGGLVLVLGGEATMAGGRVTGLARCFTWLESPVTVTALAVGDYDGDGLADIAVTDGVAVVVLRLV